MDDVLRQLGTKRENFALLLTDAAWYMFLVGKALIKGIIPYFDACHLHCTLLITYCDVRVRAFFKNVDDVVATIKAATITNKDRKNDFR